MSASAVPYARPDRRCARSGRPRIGAALVHRLFAGSVGALTRVAGVGADMVDADRHLFNRRRGSGGRCRLVVAAGRDLLRRARAAGRPRRRRSARRQRPRRWFGPDHRAFCRAIRATHRSRRANSSSQRVLASIATGDPSGCSVCLCDSPGQAAQGGDPDQRQRGEGDQQYGQRFDGRRPFLRCGFSGLRARRARR